MMFLKRFWKGDVLPGEGRYHPNPEYLKVIQTMESCEDKLKSRLSDEDFKTFREFAGAALSSACLESCDNFCDSFRLGSLMMMDVLIGSGYGDS